MVTKQQIIYWGSLHCFQGFSHGFSMILELSTVNSGLTKDRNRTPLILSFKQPVKHCSSHSHCRFDEKRCWYEILQKMGFKNVTGLISLNHYIILICFYPHISLLTRIESIFVCSVKTKMQQDTGRKIPTSFTVTLLHSTSNSVFWLCSLKHQFCTIILPRINF